MSETERLAAEVDRLREELDEHRAHYVDPAEHARVVEALARVLVLAEEWERFGGDNPGAIGIVHQLRAALGGDPS